MRDFSERVRVHVVYMLENLRVRVQREIPASGQFDMISAKVDRDIPDSYVKEMRLDVFTEKNTDISLDAVIIDIEDGKQLIPLFGGTKEDLVAYLNRDNMVEKLTGNFKTLLEYARG